MNLREALICWTPKGKYHDAGMRGQVDIYPAGTREEDMRAHPQRAGLIDERAHNPEPAVRRAYAQHIARTMIERDGLDPVLVDSFLRRNVDEYRDAFAKESQR
jgi:hypothetical protein